MRDRREDAGQYYPGGRVVPKTPTGQGGGGTSDYDQLANKPKINNHELTGNKTAEQLGLATPSDIPDVLGKLPLRALPKYLHYLAFDDTYPADAQAFYDSIGGSRVMGGCSIVRKGGLVGGNFDYPYDDACTFAIKVSAVKGANADGSDRHASVGAAYLGMRLTENIVSSGVNTPLYRVLPGMTESGINDAGVYAKINVIPRDESKDPVQSSTRNLNALAVVRYVLDHFDNAAEAANYIAAHYYIPEGSQDSYHWMICDADGTYVVEDGDVIDTATILTNHRNGTDPYGSGYSRDAILAGSGTVAELLAAVKFTNAYATGWPWPDEFAGQTDEQGKIPHTATDRLKAWAEAHVAPLLDVNRKPAARGNGCWQTVHSTIYDFEKKTMAICVQEDFSKRYVFAVDQANVDLSPIEAQIAELQDGKLDKADVVPASTNAADGAAAEAKTARHISNRDAYEEVFSAWTFTGGSGGNYSLTYTVAGEWELKDGDRTIDFSVDGPDAIRIEFYVAGIIATRTKSLVPSGKLLAADNPLPASGSLAKFAANGKMVAATPSSHGVEGDFRAPTDNECHEDSFGEWDGSEAWDFLGISASPIYKSNSFGDDRWKFAFESGADWYSTEEGTPEYLDSLSVIHFDLHKIVGDDYVEKTVEVTRAKVATKDKRFVTEDVAVKHADVVPVTGDTSLTKTIATIGGKAIKAPEGGGGGGSQGYAFVDLTPTTESGYKVFTAQDHAINRFTLVDATPVKVILPNATDANGRDFILKVNVTSATMPTFEIVKPSDAASVGIEAADDGWADLEAGINYFTITETDRA